MTIMRRFGGAKIPRGEVVLEHPLRVRLERTRRIEKLSKQELAEILDIPFTRYKEFEGGWKCKRPLDTARVRVIEMWVASREIGEDLGFLYGKHTERPRRRRRTEEDHSRTDIPSDG